MTIRGVRWTKSYFDLRAAVSEAAMLGLLSPVQMLRWMYRREDPGWRLEPGVPVEPAKMESAGFMGEPVQSGVIFARGRQAAVLIDFDSKAWMRQFQTHHDAADAVCSMGLISAVEATFASEHLLDSCPGFYDFPLMGQLTAGELVEHGFCQRA